jgi:hypothetical protein
MTIGKRPARASRWMSHEAKMANAQCSMLNEPLAHTDRLKQTLPRTSKIGNPAFSFAGFMGPMRAEYAWVGFL